MSCKQISVVCQQNAGLEVRIHVSSIKETVIQAMQQRITTDCKNYDLCCLSVSEWYKNDSSYVGNHFLSA